jgi:hypothetical protein
MESTLDHAIFQAAIEIKKVPNVNGESKCLLGF